MHKVVTRRQLIKASAGFSITMATPVWASRSLQQELSKLEHSLDATIGLWARDTGSGRILKYRPEERFALCSTFKVVLVAAVLAKSADETALLDRRITFREDQLVIYSPVTQKHIGSGMTVSELCAATLQYSDNTAANLLLEQVGGPAGLTTFARNMGDPVFRLDRNEPELNTALPNDVRDTTSPLAMGVTLQKILLGNQLPVEAKRQLQDWLKGNTTGDKRIRAGVPQGWVVGDKTGSGDYGVANDVAIIWPPGKAPWIVVIYTKRREKNSPWRDEAISRSMLEVVKVLGLT